ncbi:MAG: DUF433 domain-containing protein, partial [Mycetocola sp.]
KDMELTEHPAEYKLVKLGGSIGVHLASGDMVDIAREPGQAVVGTLENVFAEFETVRGRKVDDLLRPRAGVEVNPRRLGGWPTIVGTRIPFDTIADLVSDGSITPDSVSTYYPGVTAASAADALDYQNSIASGAA